MINHINSNMLDIIVAISMFILCYSIKRYILSNPSDLQSSKTVAERYACLRNCATEFVSLDNFQYKARGFVIRFALQEIGSVTRMDVAGLQH